MDHDYKKDNPNKKIKVKDKEGLTVSYKKEEILEHFPYLIKEISEKTKSIEINSINYQIEQIHEEKLQISKNTYPNELNNPGAIDFIRRCSNKEDAINILDYLMKRNEINKEDYKSYKNILSQEVWLERIIKESGGLKRPGYYMRKYYKKDMKNQKLNSNED